MSMHGTCWQHAMPVFVSHSTSLARVFSGMRTIEVVWFSKGRTAHQNMGNVCSRFAVVNHLRPLLCCKMLQRVHVEPTAKLAFDLISITLATLIARANDCCWNSQRRRVVSVVCQRTCRSPHAVQVIAAVKMVMHASPQDGHVFTDIEHYVPPAMLEYFRSKSPFKVLHLFSTCTILVLRL